jgi:hypothetical protein
MLCVVTRWSQDSTENVKAQVNIGLDAQAGLRPRSLGRTPTVYRACKPTTVALFNLVFRFQVVFCQAQPRQILQERLAVNAPFTTHCIAQPQATTVTLFVSFASSTLL